MKKETQMITCIICPVGCKAKVTLENEKIVRVENVECPRGEGHARKELTAPMRDFFTTVRIEEANSPVLPVRSTKPVPKDQIQNCVVEVASVVVKAPVEAGAIIVKNLCGLDVDIIATRDMNRAKEFPNSKSDN